MFRKKFMLLSPLYSADGVGGGGNEPAGEPGAPAGDGLDNALEQFGNLWNDDSVPANTDNTEPNPNDPNSAAAGDSTPGTYKYKADGQEFEADLDKLLQLASAGHNYTSKTQSLAQQREELKPVMEFMDNLKNDPTLANDFATFIQARANPNLYAQPNVQNPYANPQQNPMLPQVAQPNLGQQPLPMDPRLIQMQTQFQQQQEALNQLMQERQMQTIRKEWDDLYAKHPDAKQLETQIAQLADDYNAKGFKVDLEMAYHHLSYNDVAKKVEQNLAQNMQKKVVAKTQTPNNTSGGKTNAPTEIKTYDDAWKAFQAGGFNLFDD